ncbi:MAG: Uma2 family endonuclease [Cyanobacteria bacterium J06636_16]
MAQAKTQPKLTFEEFLEYDDGTDKRYELVGGVPVEVPAENDLNLQLAMRILGALLPFTQLELFRLNSTQIEVLPLPNVDHESRAADLIVLTPDLAEQLKTLSSSAIALSMPNPPLVVELASPYERTSDKNYRRDYVEKRKQYEQRQIPEYWIVDATAQKVTILTLKGRRYAEQVYTGQDKIISATFPALELTAEQVFARDR